ARIGQRTPDCIGELDRSRSVVLCRRFVAVRKEADGNNAVGIVEQEFQKCPLDLLRTHGRSHLEGRFRFRYRAGRKASLAAEVPGLAEGEASLACQNGLPSSRPRYGRYGRGLVDQLLAVVVEGHKP